MWKLQYCCYIGIFNFLSTPLHFAPRVSVVCVSIPIREYHHLGTDSL